MPGYAHQDNTSKIIVDEYSFDDLIDKKFYGFKYDVNTGRMVIDVVGSGEVISLPQKGIIKDDDYKTWVSSARHLNFYWKNDGDSDRLIVEVQ
jgi:hypothetical protein